MIPLLYQDKLSNLGRYLKKLLLLVSFIARGQSPNDTASEQPFLHSDVPSQHTLQDLLNEFTSSGSGKYRGFGSVECLQISGCSLYQYQLLVLPTSEDNFAFFGRKLSLFYEHTAAVI